MTKYWITFTDADDALKEVLAVRVNLEISDDHLRTRAEIPAFGIMIDQSDNALLDACEKVSREVTRRYGADKLRFGLMTIASAPDTRTLVEHENIITRARYQLTWEKPKKSPQDLELLSKLFARVDAQMINHKPNSQDTACYRTAA